MTRHRSIPALMLCVASIFVGGCNRPQKADSGKTYTPSAGAHSGSGQASDGGGSAAQSGNGQSQPGSPGKPKTGGALNSPPEPQPLNSPADTTNGQASGASDSGNASATRGAVVSEPGAPVQHPPQRPHGSHLPKP